MKYLSIDIHLALQRFNLTVQADIPLNNITAIYGDSGAGKTSLLRSIAGLEKNTHGTITCHHTVWLEHGSTQQKENKYVYIPTYKRSVGMVFQDSRLFPHLTVEKNLTYAIKRKKNTRIAYDDVIRLTNIKHLLTQLPQTLSGGEQQRVAIARAVLNEPDVLLLDEPFSALDLHHKKDLILLLQQIHVTYHLPMIYVSHSLDDIQQLADNMLVLKQGCVSLFDRTNRVIHQLNETDSIEQQTCLSLVIDQVETQQVEEYGLVALSLIKKTLVNKPITNKKNNENKNVIYMPKANIAFDISINKNKTIPCYINANEISINLSPLNQSSMMNQLPVEIKSITLLDKKALVKTRYNEHDFYTLISLFSLKKLGLTDNLILSDQNNRHTQYIQNHNNVPPTIYLQFKAGSVKTLNNHFTTL